MNIKAVHKVYFLGIGGIGMSALAAYFLQQGARVYGYDKEASKLTNNLAEKGATIHFDENLSHLQLFENNQHHLVVYTPAIPSSNALLQYAKQQFHCLKRSQVLAEISRGIHTLAVAGTHGKTSTTAMLSHILKASDVPFCAFVGGIMRNYNSNVILHPNPEYVVLEADEFDRSFLHLTPNSAVISSVDADHLDIYETEQNVVNHFKQFAKTVSSSLFVHENIPELGAWPVEVISYGVRESDLEFHSHGSYFEYQGHQVYVPMPGLYSAQNALAALCLAQSIGLALPACIKALSTFQGIERRYNLYRTQSGQVIIDDYAHHPEEIRAVLNTTKKSFGLPVNVFFQPHLFTRTRDFMVAFAEVLSFADGVFLLPIYPAREEPIEGVSHTVLAAMCKGTVQCIEPKDFSKALTKASETESVQLVIGAGSIGNCLQEHLNKEVLC